MAKRAAPLMLETAPPPRWPKYRDLSKLIRHAVYIGPLEKSLQDAVHEQIDLETQERFAESLKRHVDEGQAQLDAALAARAANEEAP